MLHFRLEVGKNFRNALRILPLKSGAWNTFQNRESQFEKINSIIHLQKFLWHFRSIYAHGPVVHLRIGH